jgi:hypothetical protein
MARLLTLALPQHGNDDRIGVDLCRGKSLFSWIYGGWSAAKKPPTIKLKQIPGCFSSIRVNLGFQAIEISKMTFIKNLKRRSGGIMVAVRRLSEGGPMAMDRMLGEAAQALERRSEEFVLGSTSTERNDSREKMTKRPLVPYVVLTLGIILLGAGLSIFACMAFAAYVILTAISYDKTLRQSILLPAELASTTLDEKRVHDCRFFLNPIK